MSSSRAAKELNHLNFIRSFYREKFNDERRDIGIMSSIAEDIYKQKMEELNKRYDEVMAAIALIDEDLGRYL